MKSIQLTFREAEELNQAVKIAQETITRINNLKVFDTSLDEIWELRNFSQQVSAILYNIHGGVYRTEVRP